MKRNILFPLLIVFTLVLAACAPAAEEPTEAPMEDVVEEATEEPMEEEMADPGTIVDIAVADGRFTTLVAALGAADLAGTLSGEGPFTVFAPTDDAFAALPEGTVEALLNDIPALTDILLYHVVEGAVFAETVVTLDAATTLQGSDVTIAVSDSGVMVNEANVIITDIEGSNGVIHVLDAVILPPADEEMSEDMADPGTIVDIAVADGRFTTLVAALEAADLVGALSGDGPFTVFAPTDDAFAALPEGTVEALLNDIPALTDILLYHVVEGAVFAETVITLDAATTLQGSDVAITVSDSGVMLNEANVIITDIAASNGVIHVIDAVILPPTEESAGTIIDIAVADGRFTTLVAALEAADLVGALSGDGPFTVFAPTDDAFAALPEGTVEALLNDIPTLTDILLYHVVEGAVTSDMVVMLNAATTLQGSDVTIEVMEGVVKVGDATVIIVDIIADNGVIHVIDAVILPEG